MCRQMSMLCTRSSSSNWRARNEHNLDLNQLERHLNHKAVSASLHFEKELDCEHLYLWLTGTIITYS